MGKLKVQAGSYLRQFGRMNRNARLYLLSNTLSSITVGIFILLYNLYLVSLGYQADFIGWLLVIGGRFCLKSDTSNQPLAPGTLHE